MVKFSEKHFSEFKKTIEQEFPAWAGEPPRAWASWIANEHPNILEKNILEKLPLCLKTRNCLYADSTNKSISDIELAISVLAWGGMNRKYGAKALEKRDIGWLKIVQKIRKGELDRMAAYEEFLKLRHAKELPGMGPAYFTKIIFFSSPKHNGYIMDQWTGRSINLLLDTELVKLIQSIPRKNGNKVYMVSDKNDKNVYEKFCVAIETLAEQLEQSPAFVEERLFSSGRGKGLWRNYVTSQA